MGKYCQHVKGELIQNESKFEIQKMCAEDVECNAIEYRASEKEGRLCTSTVRADSGPWEVCVLTGI